MTNFIRVPKPAPAGDQYINADYVLRIIEMPNGMIKLVFSGGETVEFKGSIIDVLEQAAG